MNDIPYLKRNNGKKICRTNEEECEDCRHTNMTEVVTFHFTICQKPWHCLEYKHQLDNFRLCRQMNKLWYTMRSQLESSWGRTGKGTGSLKSEHYNGYCREAGANGYERIQAPYGKPLLSGGWRQFQRRSRLLQKILKRNFFFSENFSSIRNIPAYAEI